MKQFYQLTAIVCITIFFVSCIGERVTDESTSIEASLDDAKFKETGSSQLKYDSKTGTNIVVGTEWTFLDMNISRMDAPVGSYSEVGDSVPRADNSGNKGVLGIK